MPVFLGAQFQNLEHQRFDKVIEFSWFAQAIADLKGLDDLHQVFDQSRVRIGGSFDHCETPAW